MAVSELVDKVKGLNDDEQKDFFAQVFEGMTIVNVVGLVKHLEEKWDVKASGGGGMMIAAAPAEAAADDDEQTEFDVLLTEPGQKKIAVIKEVRNLTGLNLKDAKALVDKFPIKIKEKLSKEDADKAKLALEEAGASVELK